MNQFLSKSKIDNLLYLPRWEQSYFLSLFFFTSIEKSFPNALTFITVNKAATTKLNFKSFSHIEVLNLYSFNFYKFRPIIPLNIMQNFHNCIVIFNEIDKVKNLNNFNIA
jgi:hypothetical protein